MTSTDGCSARVRRNDRHTRAPLKSIHWIDQCAVCSGRKARSTAITSLPTGNLRAGTVKARRPRVCAGAAKRSALHGAEHRCGIVVVMAVTSDAALRGGWPIKIPYRTFPRRFSWTPLSTKPHLKTHRSWTSRSGRSRASSSGRIRTQSRAINAANAQRFSPPY
jgi:hypothetical protein